MFDGPFSPRYLFKGKNSLGSTHVKQTPHNPDMMWASNTYLIVFQGRLVFLIKVQIGDKLLQDGRHEDDDFDRGGAKDEGACMISNRPVEVSTHISQSTIQYMNTTVQNHNVDSHFNLNDQRF